MSSNLRRKMPRSLGVWCKKDEVMLAVAEDGALVHDPHQRLQAPALLERTERLSAMLDDFRRMLAEVEPDEVRILMPEQTYEASYAQVAPQFPTKPPKCSASWVALTE
jgi:hypothetical protein